MFPRTWPRHAGAPHEVWSTERQYALRQRAIALGWPSESVIVIDSDLGHSGASSADREGFQKLVAEVGMGRAGIVLGLEVSRLARNSTDWHRLLEICALSDTLILDEDGIYDPAHFNDRLLLGLKGTMSEAELHVLRARLRGGLLNKARRGELRCHLPVGFVYNPQGRVVLDPDQQVQASVRLLFQTFARTGAAHATIKHFRKEGLLFPTRLDGGPRQGEVAWTSPSKVTTYRNHWERAACCAPTDAARQGHTILPCSLESADTQPASAGFVGVAGSL
jgi:DNA invertase Pin-like site-specific DNA recombinase